MNETPPPIQVSTPTKLARLSWQSWAVALGFFLLTRGLAIRIAAENISLLLIVVGFLLGLVMLALVPKFGAPGILKNALLGVVLNGLMLGIAIPNFINARNAASQRNEASLAISVSTNHWQDYQLAGLQFSSPVPLKTFRAPNDAVNTNLETYMGQLLPTGLTVLLHRRHLTAGDNYTLESFTTDVTNLMMQKFPTGFAAHVSDRTIDGIPAKQVSARWQNQGHALNDEVLILRKAPYIWEIQIMTPGQVHNAEAATEKFFKSIKVHL